mmetsp:Transcript_13785/g.22813  ORF Transcript_13785/g.22813 Transcript_13785/m.22813 type:complete len:80 (+) Transcript_13785:86-325(+)
MHPPLFRPHPDCQQFVQALTQCHEDNTFTKFFGACNGEKKALDLCFKLEKERIAKKNREENLTKRVQRRNWNDEPRPEK